MLVGVVPLITGSFTNLTVQVSIESQGACSSSSRTISLKSGGGLNRTLGA